MSRLASLLPAALLAVAACSGPPPTVTGLVDAAEIDVASRVPGRVRQVFVREGDRVVEGQRLASIQSDELEARTAQVQASIETAEARLRLARSGARPEERDQARTALESARSQLETAGKMHGRIQALLATQAATQAQADEAELKLRMARDGLAIAESRHQLVLRGARPDELEALEAQVRAGRATLAEVSSMGREAIQIAPVSGEVARVVLRRGELAAAGYPIVTLVDLDDLWVSFPTREDLLPRLGVGQTLRVQIPALGRSAEVRVFHVAAMGEYATWRATHDRAGFDLKTFEVKARPAERVEGLRPGMTVRWAPGRP